jgi:RNA polymerase sigma factor for flagellar operon FliA
MPLVRRLAFRVLRRLPTHFTIDDLIGDGCVGLVRAIDRFNPAMGLRFEAWAERIIRGSILNGLRAMDPVPERVRRDARNLDRSRWRLAQEESASPTDLAAASGAGLSSRKLLAVLLALRRAVPLSLDAPPKRRNEQGVMEGTTLGERMRSEGADPACVVAEQSVRLAVARAVSALSTRERLIIKSFYSGEASFRAIGGQLGISKQRVSQIHGRALGSLRDLLLAQRFNT